jgi:membrane protein DedA with SNARE-associated domain
MNQLFPFLTRYGYFVVFVWVLAAQIGLPLPVEPFLLVAGGMTGERLLNFPLTFLLAVVASLLADSIWFEMGRRKGTSVLSLLCRISLNPDSCVRHTLRIFSRYGAKILLVDKFIPGINVIAAPLAGIHSLPWLRFLLLDGLGVCLWAGSFVGLGYLFSDQIAEIAVLAMDLGTSLTKILVGALALYIGWKYLQRRRFLNQLRIARISPEELKKKLDAGEAIMIIDVRHSLEFEAEPQTIPGALYLPFEKIQNEPFSIPPGQEVVLYCT